MEGFAFLFGYLSGLATLLIIWIAGFVLGPWARAVTCGNPVSVMTIVGMRLRRTPPHLLIDAYTRLVKEEMKPSLAKMEKLYLIHRDDIHTAGDLVYLVKEQSKD